MSAASPRLSIVEWFGSAFLVGLTAFLSVWVLEERVKRRESEMQYQEMLRYMGVFDGR